MVKRTVFPDEKLISLPNKRLKFEDDPFKADVKLIQSFKDLRKLLAFQQDATSALRQSILFTLLKYLVSLTKP